MEGLDDQATEATAQQTMEAYYLELEMLRSEEHAHPKDWAAFIVSGDDTPMSSPAACGGGWR